MMTVAVGADGGNARASEVIDFHFRAGRNAGASGEFVEVDGLAFGAAGLIGFGGPGGF